MFNKLRLARVFLRKELRSKEHVSFFRRAGLVARGFFSEADVIYAFEKYGYDAYLSDWDRLRTRKINGEYSILLDNKIMFEQVFSRYFEVPENLCLMDGKKVVALGKDAPGSYAAAADYLRRHGAAVFKPLKGGGGHGIFFARLEKGMLTVNGEEVTPEHFFDGIARLCSAYLMTAFYEQGAFSQRLFPGTVNTLRIVTMIDPENGTPFIASCVQRIGTVRSAPTDNCEAGGLSVYVDPDTGVMGRAVVHPRGGAMEWMDAHPDTGIRFAGEYIPGWKEAAGLVLKTAGRFPLMPYVGWDIIFGDNGFCVVEGNSYTGVDLLQTHKPLLADERIRRFYSYYGII